MKKPHKACKPLPALFLLLKIFLCLCLGKYSQVKPQTGTLFDGTQCGFSCAAIFFLRFFYAACYYKAYDIYRNSHPAVYSEKSPRINRGENFPKTFLTKIQQVPAETVFVLPNNKNIIMAAQAAKELADRNVVVIESKTVPQGITAMLNFDPEGGENAIAEAMTASLSTVTTMMVTYAARNSDFDGHDIHEGDYLGLYNGALLDTNTDVAVLIREMAEKVKEEGKEFINVFYGEDIEEEKAQEVAAIFNEVCPDAEVTILNGGQPVYYYMISAE